MSMEEYRNSIFGKETVKKLLKSEKDFEKKTVFIFRMIYHKQTEEYKK